MSEIVNRLLNEDFTPREGESYSELFKRRKDDRIAIATEFYFLKQQTHDLELKCKEAFTELQIRDIEIKRLQDVIKELKKEIHTHEKAAKILRSSIEKAQS